MEQATRTGMIVSIRRRCTIAEINAGVTVAAAIPGMAYRLVGASAIAVGGAVGAVTTVDLKATLSGSSRTLVAFAQASLTQSTRLSAGDSGATILADGASFTQNDKATAITVIKNGSDLTVATHVDILLSVAIERP